MAKTVTLLQGAVDLFLRREGVSQGLRQFKSEMSQGLNSIRAEAAAAMAGVGAAITGGLAVATGKALEFNEAIAEVNTLGIQNLDGLKDAVMDVSGEFGIGLTEATKAAYQAISAGASEMEVPLVLAASAKAAKAGVAELATAVTLGMGTVNAFGKEMGAIGSVFDEAFVAVKLGVTNFNELASATGKVMPVFSALKLESKEMFASVAALTKGNIATAEAVTGLKAALSNVIKPTADAEKAAKELGIEFNSSAVSAKGLKGFLDEVAAATKGDIDALSRLFPSVEALNVVLALTGAQAGNFANILGEMSNGTKASEEAFRAWVEANPQFALDQLKQELAIVAVLIGEALLPALRDFAEWIRPIIQSTREWMQENKGVVSGVTMFVGAVGSLITAVGSAGLALKAGAFALSGFGLAAGAAAGAGGAAGAAGAGASGLSLLGAGIAGIIAMLAGAGGLIVVLGSAALAIGATIEMWRQWGIAVQERQATEAALEETIQRRINQLRAEGVVIDEVALKEKSREEQIATLSAAAAAAKEAATAREIAALTGAEATKEQVHRAELARLALNVGAKEAAVVALTDLDTEQIKSLNGLSSAQKDSFAKWLAAERELARGNDALTAQVREHLMRLSLDHRESPSVNDLAGQSFANYLGMLGQFASQQGGILAGLREMWLSTWSSIADYVSGVLASLMNAGRQALGMGGGGGGVPGYAGGTRSHRGGWMDVGHGMELVQRPTRMWAPQGTRVFSAGETAGILRAAGATHISVNVSVEGGAFLNDPRTVDRMADVLGGKLGRRLQEEMRARGK